MEIIDSAQLDPTCTETGMTAASHCAVCGKTLQIAEIIDTSGHNIVIDPRQGIYAIFTLLQNNEDCKSAWFYDGREGSNKTFADSITYYECTMPYTDLFKAYGYTVYVGNIADCEKAVYSYFGDKRLASPMSSQNPTSTPTPKPAVISEPSNTPAPSIVGTWKLSAMTMGTTTVTNPENLGLQVEILFYRPGQCILSTVENDKYETVKTTYSLTSENRIVLYDQDVFDKIAFNPDDNTITLTAKVEDQEIIMVFSRVASAPNQNSSFKPKGKITIQAGTNIRSGKDTNSSIASCLAAKTTMDYYAYSGGWYTVKLNGTFAYVYESRCTVMK